MGLLKAFDRTFLLALVPTGVVLLVAIVRQGRPRLFPYLVLAFWTGVWGVWWIVAPQMLLAFFVGVFVGWATVGRARQVVVRVRRGVAGALLRWANQIDPDRSWSRTSSG